MRLQLTRRQNLLLILLLTGLFVSLGYSISRGLGLDAWLWALLLCAALGTLTGIVGSQRPMPVVAFLLALTSLGTGALYTRWLAPWRGELKAGLAAVLRSTGQPGPPPGLAVPEAAATGLLLFAGGVLAGWAAAWLVWRRGKSFPLLLAGIAVLGGQWLWFVDAARPAMVVFWLLWLPLAGLVSAGLRQAAWTGGGSRLAHPAAGLAVGTSLVLALLLAFAGVTLPSRFQPVSVNAVSRALSDALPRLENLRGGSSQGGGRYRFSLVRTGFARSQERLGGPVRTDEREALRVRITTPDPPATLYLRGSVDTEYTGKGWATPAAVRGEQKLSANTNVVPDVMLPERLIPPLNWRADGGGASQPQPALPTVLPGTTGAVAVTVGELRTTSLFAPSGLLELKTPAGGFLRDQLGNLTTPQALAKNQTYSEQVVLLEPRSDLLQSLPHVGVSNDPSLAPYLTLPASLPPRVSDLAREVTAGAGSDYERALLLENYLRGFQYTLDVPAPPADRDFVDYFLFDLRRGYCTYSSTAMAVMLRTLGIPSRWAQGFVVPLSSGMGTYSVRNSQAHAWVEAYFPVYGWVVFDPTPRFTSPERTPLVQSGEPQTETGPGSGGAAGGGLARPGRSPLEGSEGNDAQGGSTASPGRPAFPWSLLLGWAFRGAVGVAALLLALLSTALWWRERLPAGDRRSQVRALYRNLENLLSRFDHGRAPGQTAAEWAAVLSWRWPDLAGDMQRTVAAYEAARYGGADPGPEAAGRARALWTAMRRQMRSETSLPGYLWRRLRP